MRGRYSLLLRVSPVTASCSCQTSDHSFLILDREKIEHNILISRMIRCVALRLASFSSSIRREFPAIDESSAARFGFDYRSASYVLVAYQSRGSSCLFSGEIASNKCRTQGRFWGRSSGSSIFISWLTRSAALFDLLIPTRFDGSYETRPMRLRISLMVRALINSGVLA